jgi:hypothetical protein
MVKLDEDEETALTEAMEIIDGLRVPDAEVDAGVLLERLGAVMELLGRVQV